MLKTKEYRITQTVAHIVCMIFFACALLPFLLMVIASFTDNAWAGRYGFTFFPAEWSTSAYRYIVVKWNLIGRAYLMTLLVTAAGTSISLVITTLFAYGISKSRIPGMKFVSFLLIFTMLFNGGIVSTYYCYVKFWQVKDTIWALILPNMLMNAFSVILVRNYFVTSIPASLEEAARIDGAGSFRIFARIVIPLSKPIVATIGLMTGLGYWNDWMNGYIYLTKRTDLYSIQNLLNRMIQNIQFLMQNSSTISNANQGLASIPSVSVRMAMAVVGVLPIVIVYPFIQNNFVKGITLGGVKG